MNIQLDTFFKIYGDEGTVFVAEEDKDTAELLYPGTEIKRIKKVKGYGVPLGEGLYEVFTEQFRANNFETQMSGGVVSGSLIMEPYGIRERVEL